MCKEIIDPYGFIYITTNMINGKRYIGQKKFDSGSRWKSYLGSGVNFTKAVKKYGKENFIRSIVDIAYSPEELDEKEITWISNYNAVNSEDFYNLIDGGNEAEHFKHNNSISIMCLNNRMKFNSLIDASKWSGHTVITIKKTFKEKYRGNQYKKLIFRPLNELKKCVWCNEAFYSTYPKEKECSKCGKYSQCLDCGFDFKRNSNSHVRCEKCAKERKKEKNRLTYRKKIEKLKSNT